MGVSNRELCRGCQRPIDDRYLLKVLDDAWHESCLQCCVCFQPLSFSCFIRDNQFFCKRDYEKMFGVRCRGCLEVIGTEDLVMRASQEAIFHVQCFACCVCGQLLQKGDQLSVVDSSVYCQVHSDIFLQRQNKFFNPHQHLGFCDWFAMSDDDSCSLEDGDNDQNKGPKRPRTILTTSQRRKFKASFEVNPKPCRKVRETLASETGLSVRVVQVWFQNQRAKMKKLARRQTEDGQNNGDKEKKNNQNKLANKKKKEDEVNGVLTPLSDSSSEAVGASPGESKSSEGTTDAKNNQLNTSTPLSNTDPEKRHSTSLDILLPQDLINNEKYSNDKHNFFDSYQNKNEPHNHQQQSQQHYTFLKESENGLFPHLNNTTQILQHPQKNLPFGLMQDSNPIDRLYSMQSIYFNSE